MTRHIADHQKSATGERTARFAQIEFTRAPEGSHEAAKTLHARPATRKDGARLTRFTKIEKGIEA
jgi:hypothetical protein